MKILHLAAHESSGAGRAALRLHLGLINQKRNSLMLVGQKGSNIESVIKIPNSISFYKRIQSKVSREISKEIFHCNTTFSFNATPSLIQSNIKRFNPSIINLHWVGFEFLRIEDFKSLKTPLVWTLQDMWSFTGGCHYNEGCDRYTDSCGVCPQLQSSKKSDISHWVWRRKAEAWKNLDLTIVAPTSWIAECAKASSLFRNLRVEVIPFCLDIEKYKPVDRKISRELLGLPQGKKLVLFGAISATKDKRKGFHLLLPALQKLSKAGWQEQIELVIFGATQPKESESIELGFKAHYLGSLSDDASLVRAYSAADVMLVPSTQESFGQTASESLACGTPVVAFNATGLKDIVDHQQNGYLAEPYEIDDLARGISWVLENEERHQKLRYYAREKAEKAFSLETQARDYLSLYNEILANK